MKITKKILIKIIKESFNWPNYYLKSDGQLYDDKDKMLKNAPKFKSKDEAEIWLQNNSKNGNVFYKFSDYKFSKERLKK